MERKNQENIDLEMTEKALTEELKKCHLHIDNQRKCIQELAETNKCIPKLSNKIKDITGEVNTKISLEKKKLAAERKNLKEEIYKIQNTKDRKSVV